MDFVQHILNGLLQGCILALIGLGFSLVWGILNIVNLAHAAFINLAAYLTYILWSLAGIDPFVTQPNTKAVLFVAG
jgi:branched-chain amino acid transport system permease protein